MKKLLAALLFIPIWGFSQIETYKVVTNPWNSNGDMNVAIYKPAGYADSPLKVWPVIEFYHGDGDQGTDVNKILNNYIFKLIRDGKPPEAINPITGHLERFIVIEAQDRTGGTVWPPNYKYIWDYLRKTVKLRVDTTRIYTMGHSYGGAGDMLAASWDNAAAKRIAAVASLSPHADLLYKKQNIPLMVKDSIGIWFYTGTLAKDGFTAYANAFDALYRQAGGKSLVTIFNGGHDAAFWNNFYSGNVTRLWQGKQMNVYEYFLTHKKGGYGLVTPEWPLNPQICVGSAQDIKEIIILMKDGTYRRMDSTHWSFPEVQLTTPKGTPKVSDKWIEYK